MKENVKKVIRSGIRGLKHKFNSYFLKEYSLVILLYHRISPNNEENRLGTVLNKEVFKKQMQFLKDRYEITTLKECFAEEKNVSKNLRVAITFDDGYVDNFKYAFPILKELDISATFFLATNYINSGKPIWDQHFQIILDQNKQVLSIEDPQNNFLLERGPDLKDDVKFLWEAINYLRFISPVRRQEILYPILNLSDKKIDLSLDRCLSWDEIDIMKKDGMDFGSHGCSHSSLINLSEKEMLFEVSESKKVLESKLSEECLFFALPFGSQLDFDEKVLKEVKNTGYLRCLLNIRGNNFTDSDQFSLKRKSISTPFDFDNILG